MTTSESKFQEMSNSLYWKSLPKCGIVGTYPIEMRHLSHRYQSLGLPNLYLEQEISKVRELLGFAYTDSVLWEQMQAGLEIMQKQVGTLNIVLNADYNQLGCLVEDSWLSSVWKFLSDQQYHIKGWKHQIPIMRRNDNGIMDTFSKSNDITHAEMKALNECRIYLQAWTISDIADGSGHRITENAYSGRRDKYTVSMEAWPETRRPRYEKWEVWRRYVCAIMCEGGERTLKHSLGPWINTSRHSWQWYYCSDDSNLYQILGSQNVGKYVRTNRFRQSNRTQGSRWYKYHSITRAPEAPMCNWHKATICETSRGLKYVRSDGWTTTSISPQHIIPYEHNVKNLLLQNGIPEWMCQYGNLHETSIEVINRYFEQPFRFVTDASYDKGIGAACIILELMDQSHQFIFTTAVPDNMDNKYSHNDPYRSELMGIYAGIRVLRVLELKMGKSSKVIVSCDNDQALFLAAEYRYINANIKHFDLAKATLGIKKTLSSELSFEEVVGHADEKFINRKLSRTEQLNKSCDILAKIVRDKYQRIQIQHFEHEGLSLWKTTSKVYTNLASQIRDSATEQRAIKYLCEKHSWTTDTFQDIDWESLHKATKLMTTPTIIRMTKVVTKTLPVGRVMERRKQWKETYCPRCGQQDETASHIIVCPHVESRNLAGESLMKINTWMEQMNTDADLRFQIIHITSLWISSTQIVLEEWYLEPIKRQIKLGWGHFVEGRVHISITNFMNQHYLSIKSRKTGTLWTAVLIQKLWVELFGNQWTHRNSMVHSLDRKKKESREHENLNFTVKQIYGEETAVSLMQRDKHLMVSPLTKIIKKPTAQKRAWLHMMQLAQNERDEAHAKETTSQANAMHSFLTSYRERKRTPIPSTPKRRVNTRRRKKPRLVQTLPLLSPDTSRPKRTIKKRSQQHKHLRGKTSSCSRDANKWSTNGDKESLRRGSWRQP